jgi:recombination protein RecA
MTKNKVESTTTSSTQSSLKEDTGVSKASERNPEKGSEKKGAKPLLDVITRTVESICERFGKGALMALGSAQGAPSEIESVSTGSLSIDRALGVGGLPKGRIIEIFGPEASGKTSLTLHVIAQAQQKGQVCAFIDAEHALDLRYAAALGVQTDQLLVSQPDHGEQALEIVDSLARSGAIGLIVVDSVAALIPKAELEGDMGDAHMGLQARLMSQAMRKLSGVAAQTGTSIVFINQLRQKIGVTFGNPEVTTGGNALKYYASVRLDIRRIGSIKDGENVVGSRTRVKVVKNKCAPPFAQAEFDIVHGKGIDTFGEVLDAAIECGLAQKSGSWISMGNERLGQGRAAAITWLREHPVPCDELRQKMRMISAPASSAPEAQAA